MEEKDRQQSIRKLVDFVSGNLAGRPTHRQIREFLEKHIRYHLPKSAIETIGKELSRKRSLHIETLVEEFKNLNNDFTARDFRHFFVLKGLPLTRGELRKYYPATPRPLLSFRVSARESEMISFFADRMKLSHSSVRRFLIIAGLASLTGDTAGTLGKISSLYRTGIDIPDFQFEFIRMALIGSGWFRTKPKKNI